MFLKYMSEINVIYKIKKNGGDSMSKDQMKFFLVLFAMIVSLIIMIMFTIITFHSSFHRMMMGIWRGLYIIAFLAGAFYLEEMYHKIK